MSDELCVRCGKPAEGFTVYRGWRLCHGRTRSCYDVAYALVEPIVKLAQTLDPDTDVSVLQQRLEANWALLQDPNDGPVEGV
jgi:hypothetical protein